MGIIKSKESLSGKVQCKKSILLSIISLATKEINGIHSLVDTRAMKFKKLFIKNDVCGVKIFTTLTQKLVIDVYVKIFNGSNVPDLAFKVQENIRNSIKSMIETEIESINVNVVDVEFEFNY